MVNFLAYLFYFVASTASPIQRRWLATVKSTESNNQIRFAFHVSLVISILGLSLLFYEPFQIRGDLFLISLAAAACGIFGAASYIALYVAQKHVEAGVTSVVSNIYTPITIILSSVLLHEKLTDMQIVGTVFLFIGMIIISKKHRIGRFRFDKYFLLMILSGILLGFLLTSERYLQKTTGFTTGALISWWATCLFLGIASAFTQNGYSYTKSDLLITGGLRFAQNLSWVSLVFVVGNLSVVSAITTFKVVLMFIVGFFLLHERGDLIRKIVGVGIAMLGLLFMK